MTSEHINIAIAKVCGYTFDYWPDESGRFSVIKDDSYVQLPDYYSDLNAMHEAEKVLTEMQQKNYALEYLPMVLVINGRARRLKGEEFTFVHATAAQRAEAFLRTLNLWES